LSLQDIKFREVEHLGDFEIFFLFLNLLLAFEETIKGLDAFVDFLQLRFLLYDLSRH